MNNYINCNNELNGNYCSNCGQPTQLKRIDAHYIKHELEHILHVEKGILYTIKELFLKPGNSVRVFFTENRNRLVKPIIFIIITSLVYTLANNYFHIEDQYIKYEDGNSATVSTTAALFKWVQSHYGYSNIIMGLFIAIYIQLFFKKSDYNFYEILILLCFIMGMGMLILSIFAILQGLFQFKTMQFAALAFLIYTIFAIADFFDKRRIKSYVKAFAAYILGTLTCFLLLLVLGNSIDLILKH